MRLPSLSKFAKPLSSIATQVSSSGGTGGVTGLSPVAIDFGVASIKMLQVNIAETTTLAAAASLETPAELMAHDGKRIAWQLEQVPKLLKQGGFKGRRAVAGVPASQTFCKHAQVPKGDGVDLKAIVGSMVAGQIGCDQSALVYRFVEVAGTTGAKGEVICMATPRELMARVMQSLKPAKFELVGGQSEFHALLRAFAGVGRRAEDAAQATLYIDIGRATTKAVIAHGKDMVFARLIQLGGAQFDEAVAKRDGLNSTEAHAARVAGAATPGEAIEMLADEIGMCVRYHESLFQGRRVERAVFAGGESRDGALCREIARRLRLTAQAGDPLASVGRTGNEPASGVDFKTPQPGWAVALGLCLSPTDL